MAYNLCRVWEFFARSVLPGRPYTYLHGCADVTARWVWKYVDLPCVLWLCLDCKRYGIYIRWPADALSFVFTKYKLWLIYNRWFLEFSGNLHEANMSGRVTMTVENVFVENNILWECVLGDEFGICFDSHVVCARQQQLPNSFILNWFCMWMVWEFHGEERLFSGLAFVDDWNAFATCANAWWWWQRFTAGNLFFWRLRCVVACWIGSSMCTTENEEPNDS